MPYLFMIDFIRHFPDERGPGPVSEPGYRPRGLEGKGFLFPAREDALLTPATGFRDLSEGLPA